MTFSRRNSNLKEAALLKYVEYHSQDFIDMSLHSDQDRFENLHELNEANLNYIKAELEQHGDEKRVRESALQLPWGACREQGDEIPSIVSRRLSPDGWRITKSEAERDAAACVSDQSRSSAPQTSCKSQDHISRGHRVLNPYTEGVSPIRAYHRLEHF